MTPFEAYKKFLAVRMHFDSNYDYFKFNGRIKASEQSFNRKRDQWQYAKLARYERPMHQIVSNAIDSNLKWVGDLLKPEADEIRINWEKRIESLTYTYTCDLKHAGNTFDILRVHLGDHPRLLKLFFHKEISPETLVILNDLINFIDVWDQKITEPYIWPALSHKLKKYRPFITIDREKMKKITMEHFA